MSDEERPRRDPRQARANVRKPGEARVEPIIAEAAGRQRKDPRAERAALRTRPLADVPALAPVAAEPPRLRRDPRDRSSLRQSATAPVARAADEIIRVENPAAHILAVLELDGGVLSRADRDLLGAARNLADAMNGAVVAVVCIADQASMRFDAASSGVDRLLCFVDPAYRSGLAAQKVDAVASAVALLDAAHILFSDSAESGELGRRVAARLATRPAVGAIRLAPDAVTCLVDGGRSETTGATPRVILLRPDSFEPVAAAPRREARIIPPPLVGGQSLLQDRGLLPIEPATIPLAEADLIVSAGNGVSDWPGFHQLAFALGAAEGGSRVAVDAGYLPRNRQIGASGTLVVPRCYIALGISGASQHLDGIVDCPRVVAVNIDPHADIMKRADLAIVGDVQAIIPALTRRAEAAP